MSENKENKKEFNIEKWVLKIQAKLTILLSILFMSLMVYMMFGDVTKANSLTITFLPIITGWLGIVFGFYFSREISNFLEQKLGKRLKEEDKTLGEYQETIEQIEQERKEEREQFTKIIDSRGSLINNLRGKVHELLEEKNKND